MTQQTRIRYKPDVMTDKTLVANAAPDGSSGTLFFDVQAVTYDDAVVTSGNYKPGDPSSEANITVVFQDVLQFDLAALAAMSGTQQTVFFAAQLDAWATANKPLATILQAVRLRAMKVGPRPVP